MAQTDLIGDEPLNTVLMGERTFGWGLLSERPSSNFHANGWYLATDTAQIFQNTGTEATPVWSEMIASVNIGLIFALGD